MTAEYLEQETPYGVIRTYCIFPRSVAELGALPPDTVMYEIDGRPLTAGELVDKLSALALKGASLPALLHVLSAFRDLFNVSAETDRKLIRLRAVLAACELIRALPRHGMQPELVDKIVNDPQFVQKAADLAVGGRYTTADGTAWIDANGTPAGLAFIGFLKVQCEAALADEVESEKMIQTFMQELSNGVTGTAASLRGKPPLH